MTAIDTPCIKVCTLDPRLSMCIGCGRSIEEIGRWTSMSDAERRHVMAALPDRLAQLHEQRTKAAPGDQDRSSSN